MTSSRAKSLLIALFSKLTTAYEIFDNWINRANLLLAIMGVCKSDVLLNCFFNGLPLPSKYGRSIYAFFYCRYLCTKWPQVRTFLMFYLFWLISTCIILIITVFISWIVLILYSYCIRVINVDNIITKMKLVKHIW